VTERVIIDIYQYTMLCLTANANTIAAFAIQLATHMLGFGTKIREFHLLTSARELREAKLLFCEAIDDTYRSDMVRSSPNVRTFLLDWYNYHRSEFQTVLETHCSQYEHEQNLPWRQFVDRSRLDLPNQTSILQTVRIVEVVDPAATAEAAAVQSVVVAARSADEQNALANGRIGGIGEEIKAATEQEAAVAAAAAAAAAAVAAVADVDNANNKGNVDNDHVDNNVDNNDNNVDNSNHHHNNNHNNNHNNINNSNNNNNHNNDDDDDDDNDARAANGSVFLPDDVVVSSPVPIVVGGDSAARTSPPESSPEEGELPLTRSLEALRRSVRTKRRRVVESK
jgi:hypothetical protein